VNDNDDDDDNNNNNNALYTLHHLISANMDLKLGLYTGVKYGMAYTKYRQFHLYTKRRKS
jgi:hypothetical protein